MALLTIPSSGQPPASRCPPLMHDIYCSSSDDRWRFTLGRSGRRKLLVIALNSSTATQEKSDTTVELMD